MNNQNPVFLQHVRVMIRPGQNQMLMVKVVDLDGDVDERFVEVELCTSLATVECSMDDLLSTVGNKGKCLVLPEIPEQTANPLSVALFAEYVSRPRGRVEFKISGLNIHVDEKSSTDGKPAILYEILREIQPARHMPEGTPSRFVRVYKSEMSSSTDPDWENVVLEEASLDNGVPGSKFVINVSNFQADGSYRLIGTVKMDSVEAAGYAGCGKDIFLVGAMAKQSSLGRLMRRSIQRSLQRVSNNPSSKSPFVKVSHQQNNDHSVNAPAPLRPENSALSSTSKMPKAESKLSRLSSHKTSFPAIRIERWEVKNHSSMADFLRAGAEVQFMLGIDMTKENKHPDKRGSLHFLLGSGPSSLSRYEEVILRIQRLLTGRNINRTNGGFSLQPYSTGQQSDFSLAAPSMAASRRNPMDMKSSLQLRARVSNSPLEYPGSYMRLQSNGSMGPLSFAASAQSTNRGIVSGAFSVLGFGAHKPGMPPSHVFPFSQRGTCADFAEFSRSYRHALTKWRLSGPRHFAPIIEESCSLADREVDREAAYSASLIANDAFSDPPIGEGNKDWQVLLPPTYTILIILTCGPPEDLKETLDAMTRASSLPVSIVVIDVNDMELANDFRLRLLDERGRTTEEMRQMYSFLSHLNDKKPERPNVHFVQYRKHPLMGEISDEELMLDILSSVPAQYLEYCRARGFEVPKNQDFAFSQRPIALNEVTIHEGEEVKE